MHHKIPSVIGHVRVTDHKLLVTVRLDTRYTFVIRSDKTLKNLESHEIIATQPVGDRLLLFDSFKARNYEHVPIKNK